MPVKEVDVFKLCIKEPHYLKDLDLLEIPDTATEEAKQRGKKDLLKLFYRVWSGFTKFIKSQVTQDRCAYSPNIGKILKKEGADSNQYIYIPSIEFVEVGKFVFKEDEFNLNPYTDVKKRTVNVSPSAIAQVCETNRDTVQLILKEIFVKMAEIARKGEEVKLDLKVGYLIARNSELRFRNYSLTSDDNTLNQKPVGSAHRVTKSFDVGRHRTGRDSYITHLDSVRTPYSNRISTASSSKNSIYHPANPNPQSAKSTYPDRLNRSDIMSASKKSEAPVTVPYPFLTHFLGHSPDKFGKKMAFNDRPTNGELFETHVGQIKEKESREYNEKMRLQNEERQRLNLVNQAIYKERKFMDDSLTKQKNDFVSENDQFKLYNQHKKASELAKKKTETYDYFPFTHGTQIEQKQAMQRSYLKNELNDYYTSNPSSAVNRSMMSTNGKVPVKFVAEYPVYLRPNKYYPHRRTTDYHVEKVMQNALEKYENDLVKLEHEKQKDAQELKTQLDNGKKYYEELERKKIMNLLENKEILERQKEEERERRARNRSEGKVLVRTNFGPEENDNTYLSHVNTEKNQKDTMRAELLRQIKEKSYNMKDEKNRERIEDVEGLVSAAQVMHKEHNEILSKEAKTKKLYSQAWNEQIKMKNLQAKIQDSFKS